MHMHVHVHVHVANMLVWHVFQCIPTTMEIGRYRKQKSRTVQVLKLTINTRAKKMIVNQHRNKNSPSHTPLTPSHPHTLTVLLDSARSCGLLTQRGSEDCHSSWCLQRERYTQQTSFTYRSRYTPSPLPPPPSTHAHTHTHSLN